MLCSWYKRGGEGRVKSQWRFPSNPALYTECGVARRGEIISFILLVLVIYVGLFHGNASNSRDYACRIREV